MDTATITTVMANITNTSTSAGIPGLETLDKFYNNFEGLFAAFYVVKPSRTMCADVESVPNFYNMLIQVVPIMFAMEFLILKAQGKPAYKWNDSLMGFAAYIMAAVPQAFIETIVFGFFYSSIYDRFRVVDIPYDSYWTWLLAIVALDLSLYVAHRSTHEVNVLWASHQLHHSSEYYNFFTAARNSFIDKFIIGCCALPWAFLIPPGPALAHHQLNLVYQLWIHTLTVGHLGPLEYILSTPTQHAMHHGRNRFCIDINYAGFLSIWDQLFGTMKWPKDHEGEKIYYGLVSPTRSWDLCYSYFHAFRNLGRRAYNIPGLGNKVRCIVYGPGWEPGKPRLGLLEDIPEIPEGKDPYDKKSTLPVYLYCLSHVFIIFFMNNTVVGLHRFVPYYVQLIGFLFIVWTLFNIGYILEHKTYLPRLEWTRCAAFFAVDWLIGPLIFTNYGSWLTVVKVWYALSAVLWVFNLDYYRQMKSKAD